jgi:hypothetical protein
MSIKREVTALATEMLEAGLSNEVNSEHPYDRAKIETDCNLVLSLLLGLLAEARVADLRRIAEKEGLKLEFNYKHAGSAQQSTGPCVHCGSETADFVDEVGGFLHPACADDYRQMLDNAETAAIKIGNLRVVQGVRCPFCGAWIGSPCTAPSGVKLKTPHRAREKLYRQEKG